jgi:hypothetical protein
LYLLESTTVVCFERVTGNPVCMCVPIRSAWEGAKGRKEVKEKTSSVADARRGGSGCSPLSGCDNEVWVVMRKQYTVAFFQGRVNSQKYQGEGRVESRLGDAQQRCAKKYYVQAANVAQSDKNLSHRRRSGTVLVRVPGAYALSRLLVRLRRLGNGPRSVRTEPGGSGANHRSG